ncbi:MAG: imelysin family protein [Thiotrichales bacterium]
MNYATILKTAALTFTFAAVAACSGGGGGGETTEPGTNSVPSSKVSFAATALINNEADAIITQTYKNLNSAAAELQVAVQALAADGATGQELDAAQEKWKVARRPWEQSEGFLFGPVDSLGVDPAIDSWPLNISDLSAFLTARPSATQADVDNAADDLRGFHAIEWLLFGDGVDANDRDAATLSSAELNYLVALTAAFKGRTQALEDAWVQNFNGRGPYANLLKTAGVAGNTIYASRGAVIEELVNGLATIADEVANAKIAEPLGTSIGTADTTKVESQFSWNSLTDFHDNLQSILNAYTGKLGYNPASDSISDTLNGLYAFVLKHDATLANRVLDEIITAQRRIALIKGDGIATTTAISGSAKPFRQQILNDTGRALITEAMAATNKVFNSFTDDVLPLIAKTEFTN